MATASSDSTIKIWNINNFNQNIQILQGHTGSVNSLCYLQLNTDCLISCSNDRSIKVWRRGGENYGLSSTIIDAHPREVNALLKLPNNQLASSSADGSIKIWLIIPHNNQIVLLFQRQMTANERSVRCLILSSNLKEIISGSEDETIKIWNYLTGELIRTLPNVNSVCSLILLTNERFASGSTNGLIRIWSRNSEQPLSTFNAHINYVLCLASMNRNILVSGSQDTTVKLWNLNLNDDNLMQQLDIQNVQNVQNVQNSLVFYKS